MDQANDPEDMATLFVMYLEGKFDRVLDLVPFAKGSSSNRVMSSPEIGEGPAPAKALLFKKGSISLISGKSSSLTKNGFKPFENSHFTTQFALIITQAMASFHAMLRVKGINKLHRKSSLDGNPEEQIDKVKLLKENYDFNQRKIGIYPGSLSDSQEFDSWTYQVSRASLVSSNLSILCTQLEQEHVSSRILNKLESLQSDMGTFTQFLQFSAAMQSDNNKLQSVGPICMCDVWVPDLPEDEYEQTLVIRLRGGLDVQAPPMRDITWIWLTLLRPDVLQDRYIELCESYCSSYNDTIKRLNTGIVQEITLFEIMRDLGDSFLHGFLTLVHKFTISGVWSLDRQLHTSEGIRNIADSVGFLVDNGIISSLFIA